MTTQTTHRGDATRRTVRALGALGALVFLVAAVPLVLATLMQALPLDPGALSPSALGRPEDGRLLLWAIVAVAWVAWAGMVLSVGVEAWAALRRVPTPRLPGLAVQQRVASGLIAAVVVALSPAAGGPAVGMVTGTVVGAEATGAVGVAAARSVTSASAALDGSPRTQVVTATGRPTVEAPAVEPAAGVAGRTWATPPTAGGPTRWAGRTPDRQGREVTVQTERHDTLWMLAEQYLGAGERYLEIVALNRDVEQPDGRSLGDDGRIYPGWTLVLPADADVDAARPARHRVVPGDTLWAIAEDQLGDPTRYPDIVAANRGDLQPDGRRLSDPDLILPGWVLEVPGSTEASSAGSTAEGAAGTAEAAEGAAAEEAGPVTALVEPPQASDGAEEMAGAPVTSLGAIAPIDRAGAGHSGAASDGGSRSVGVPAEPADPAPVERDAETPAPAEVAAPDPPVPDAGGDPRGSTPEGVGPVIALPSGGGLTALLLVGVGAELVRRRRQFQRHRRAGERMPAPGVGARQVERAVRAAGREPGLDLVARALGELAEQAETGGMALPDVRLVRVGAQSVVLDLGAPADQSISPFVAVDPCRWVLSAELLPAEAPDRPRAFPGLVTLGVAGPETVLINLESVGTLAVAGSAEATADVLRGFAADLTFGPASTRTEQVLCLADTSIAEAVEAGGIAVEEDPARASSALAARLAATLPSAGSMGADPVRSAPPVGDPLAADPLFIVLSDRDLDVAVPPRSGCALITTAPVAAAGATLVLQGETSALLLPERERLTPQHLSAAATGDLVEVLRGTDLPDPGPVRGPESRDHGAQDGSASDTGSEQARTGPVTGTDPGEHATADRPTPDYRSAAGHAQSTPGGTAGDGGPPAADGQAVLWDSQVGRSAVIDLRESHSGPGPRDHAPALFDSPDLPDSPGAAAPRILLLGEVLVENADGRCESTRIGRLAETAAFVLLNPGARPSELQGALWPGRRSNPQTCRQMISRARTWLGRTDAGEPYLMTLAESEGRLRLRDEVGSDWADFQRLSSIGLADPEDIEHLAAALALVRGRPFGAVASRELPWADIHINDMISAISDVAHALAVRHEAAGRRSAARDAALRGLLTDSESEVLEQIVARTAV